jgi:hypothetical protein
MMRTMGNPRSWKKYKKNGYPGRRKLSGTKGDEEEREYPLPCKRFCDRM